MKVTQNIFNSFQIHGQLIFNLFHPDDGTRNWWYISNHADFCAFTLSILAL